MKKTTIILFALSLIFLTFSCTNQTQSQEEISTTQTHQTTQYITTRTAVTMPEPWPDFGPCPEGGIYIEGLGYTYDRFRPAFYVLSYHFARLVGIDVFMAWERTRVEEFHHENIAVSFVRYFNISREDFARANEEQRASLARHGHAPENALALELYPIDLIFTFDNDRINEFFRWENSIFAHVVGMPNPLRGEWDENGIGRDHPNWTENPAWREHPFWPYLPFGDSNDSTSVVWNSYAEFRAANPQ